ncbi:hypothetical protein Pmani_003814 [Petrolisthes manimaculis]|uniref:Uncharacterized protein n=1 Tax=Petrolisthes manimaculis TaxID=1843537 RepID=A0AAE1UJ38_9EUCA|nr:hypothetical protein Pmani_003814 [Petrolisthes manimaculis]
MSGRGKPVVAVKKVSPPTVPDSTALTHRHSGSSFSSGVYSGGDQRSSYSSSVSDENPPPSPRSPARGKKWMLRGKRVGFERDWWMLWEKWNDVESG